MAVTGEPVSHCAIRWDNLVIHSDLLGLRIEFVEEFLARCEIVHTVELGETEELRTRLTRAILTRRGRIYDLGALLFLGGALLLRSKLGISLPKSNLWRASGMYLCTEFITDIVDSKEDSMITPMGLYNKLTTRNT